MINLFHKSQRPQFHRVHRVEHRPGLGHRQRRKVYAPFNAVEQPNGSIHFYWGSRRSFNRSQREC